MSNSPKLSIARGTPSGTEGQTGYDPYGTSPGTGYARGYLPGEDYSSTEMNDASHWTTPAPDWYKWEDLKPGSNGGPPYVEVGSSDPSFTIKPQGTVRIDSVLACESGSTTQSQNYTAANSNGNEWTVTETTVHDADTDHFYVFAHYTVNGQDTATIMTDPMIRNDGRG